MSHRSIWLVRHGQASFGKSDYDNLSDQGHEQAFTLGKSFARRGIRPDVLMSGSMRRHRQTLAEIAIGAGWHLTEDEPVVDADNEAHKDGETKADKKADKRGDRKGERKGEKKGPDQNGAESEIRPEHAPPRVRRLTDERWNELDHMAMLAAYRPAYKNMLVLKADMMRTLRPRIAFEDTFEKAVDRWTSGEHDDYPESFTAFTERTEAALQEIIDGDAEHVIVVTSAGPVCWIAAHLAAGGSLDTWKHFTLAACNTGVTRITVDRHGPRLLSFNEFAHLESAGIVTNR